MLRHTLTYQMRRTCGDRDGDAESPPVDAADIELAGQGQIPENTYSSPALATQRPLFQRKAHSTPRKMRSAAMAVQTPARPTSSTKTRMGAQTTRTPHIQKRARNMGKRTSWAPRRAPESTMKAAKKGSDTDTMRSTSAAWSMTA